MNNKIFVFSIVFLLFAACTRTKQDGKTHDQSIVAFGPNGNGEGADGRQLANLTNAVNHCTPEIKESQQAKVTCKVYVKIETTEVLADDLSPGTQLTWQPPVFDTSSGHEVQSCEVKADSLSQSCDIKLAKNVDLNIEFKFEIKKVATGDVASKTDFVKISEIMGRYISIGTSTDTNVDNSKTALLPGQTSSYANYVNYNMGLTGITIDVSTALGDVTINDFELTVGTSAFIEAWQAAPAPAQIISTTGGGLFHSNRINLVWNNNVIKDTWIKVKVKATPNTGLSKEDIFYFGHLAGAYSDPAANLSWALIYEQFRNNFGKTGLPLSNPYDVDKDGDCDNLDYARLRVYYGKPILGLIQLTL